jgi:hypothetical protein
MTAALIENNRYLCSFKYMKDLLKVNKARHSGLLSVCNCWLAAEKNQSAE